jgi:hypothetical protein
MKELFSTRQILARAQLQVLVADGQKNIRDVARMFHTKRRYEKNCCSAFYLASTVPSGFSGVSAGRNRGV